MGNGHGQGRPVHRGPQTLMIGWESVNFCDDNNASLYLALRAMPGKITTHMFSVFQTVF